MNDTRIIKYEFENSERIDTFSWERRGGAGVSTENNGSKLTGLMRSCPKHFTPCMTIAGRNMFARAAVRHYLDRKGKEDYEFMMVNTQAGMIERVSLADYAEANPLKLLVDASEVTAMGISHDGRYLAVGTGSGSFEIWNLDEGSLTSGALRWQGPSRLTDLHLASRASILDLSFSRTNRDLYVTDSYGDIYQYHMFNETMTQLSDDDVAWNCYSIDCQPEGEAVAFAGEDPVVWILNLKTPFWHESVMQDLNPFAMRRCRSFTGGEYWTLTGAPRATLSCLLTNVGSYVAKVKFLSDHRIAVLGPIATEVWDIRDRVRLVSRKTHYPDYRLLDLAGDEETVRVALGV